MSLTAAHRLIKYIDKAALYCESVQEMLNFFMGHEYPLSPWPRRKTVQEAKEYIWDRHNFIEADEFVKLKLDALDRIEQYGKIRRSDEWYEQGLGTIQRVLASASKEE